MTGSGGRARHLLARTQELGRALQGALEIARLSRLSEQARTPYTVLRNERSYSLRRYAAQPGKPRVEHPLLLVPSLMVSAELYDLAPDSSAVQFLARQGIDTWLCDFGRPEQGDMSRTQDDYVHALDDCIELIRETTGKEVHLAGCSQGGMVAYQLAALRRGEGLKSLITLCAPVDLHQNSALDPDLIARGIEFMREGTLRGLRKLDALPSLTVDLALRAISLRSRLRSHRKRDAAAWDDIDARRRLLGLGAFLAWPGPALRRFTDELVLSNRLLQGGFLLTGKVCSLSDLNLPVLYFVAERDDVARPRAVRAIRRAAPQLSELYEIAVPTGHVGLLVGKRAFEVTWPSVVAWLRWREGAGPKPVLLFGQDRKAGLGHALSELTEGLDLLRDAGTGVAHSVTRGVALATKESLKLGENLRFQAARLAKLEQLTGSTRVSFGRELTEKAARNPDGAWFMYDGRGQSYQEANRRVDHVVRALIACGVRPGQHLGVLMNNRPSYLSLVTALSRLGAVAVLLSPHSERASLARALELSPIDALVSDPENVARAQSSYAGKLLLLGAPKAPRPALQQVVDMESIDTHDIALPDWYRPNPGLADELAMITFTTGADDTTHATRVTNRKWAVAGYSAAAFAALTPKDTVYACTPLHHPSAMLVAVAGALLGGARLALSAGFAPERFWPEVRRFGVSVVFYSGDVLRELVHAPSYRGEQYNPIRLLAGSGIRADTQRRLRRRFGDVKVLEYYASAAGPGMLANTAATKIGALGKPPPGDDHLLLAVYDFEAGALVRDESGMCIEAGDDEPGVLLARIDHARARTTFDGYAEPAHADAKAEVKALGCGREQNLVRNVRQAGDRWYFTGDVMRRDPQRDYWPLDRAGDVIHTSLGPAFTRPIEDVLYELSDVRVAVVHASRDPRGQQRPEATLVMVKRREPSLDALNRLVLLHLSPHERPQRVRCVDAVPMSDGNRPLKASLRAAGPEDRALAVYRYDEASARYVPAGEGRISQPAGAR
jgi:putative long chain acyl-CoA synthase